MPNATKVIAVTESLIPNVQPNIAATSPINAVNIPMTIIATIKQSQPKYFHFILIFYILYTRNAIKQQELTLIIFCWWNKCKY